MDQAQKLSAEARTRLRAALRKHPGLSKFVSNQTELVRMTKAELFDLAERLEIDVGATIAGDRSSDFHSTQAWQRMERSRSSHDAPAFRGSFEFDLEMHLFGHHVKRLARVKYQYTPDWDYYDLRKKRVTSKLWMSNVSIEVLAIYEHDAWFMGSKGKLVKRKNVPTWTEIQISEEGVLPEAVWDEIDRLIDGRCRAEDEQRRTAFNHEQQR